MTARQVFEAMLVELNNTSSPSLLLDDYNHFINKAIDMYINKRYANYDTTQQTTDDLRVLKSTAILPVEKKIVENNAAAFGSTGSSADKELYDLISKDKSFDAIYEVNLPADYLHTLNCTCIYSVNKTSGCYDAGDVARYAAKRLTADSWSTIINDYYDRPTPKNPYYYIHNINTSKDLPTNRYVPESGTLGKGTDLYPATTSSTTTVYELYKDGKRISTHNSLNLANAERNKLDILPVSVSAPTSGATGLTIYKNTDNKYVVYNGTAIVTTKNTKEEADAIVAELRTALTAVATPAASGFSIVSVTVQNNTPVNFATMINSNNIEVSTIEKKAGIRYGNASTVRMEIRYGQGDVFILKGVMIDYVKAPQHVRLTKNQLDLTEDTSQILEFPDYVCQEIINQLVTLVMANNGDPRLQTTPVVSQSIVDVAQQQQAAAQQRAQRQI